MNKDLAIIGFTAAEPGWVLLDYDIGMQSLFKIPITAWVLTRDLLSLPVSPQVPLISVPAHIPIMSPGGHIFNRLGEEWDNMDDYLEYAKKEITEEAPEPEQN